MRPTSRVSRPGWVTAMNVLASAGPSTNTSARRSPVELVANAASVVTRSPYVEATGIARGKLGRWTDGVAELRAHRTEFAAYWAAHNQRVLENQREGPLWVVLGDSTAQGLGAPGPHGGYVGQALQQLRRSSGKPWQVLNLSVSGALMRDVVAEQIPLMRGQSPDLVTCGAGVNDILYSTPGTLFGDLRTLLSEVPDKTVMLDLPLLTGFWGIVGRISVPYITRINRVIREVAAERGLQVASVSSQFVKPWTGKFSADNFHPSQDGYRDWTRALLETVQAQQPGLRAA